MTAAAVLSNALDTGSLDGERGLSNALDKAEANTDASQDWGLSNALDKWEAGPPGAWSPPPRRRLKVTPEGPVLPALRRFGVPENRREDSMPRI